MFEAQRVTTKYCTHGCNAKHYKIRMRVTEKDSIENIEVSRFAPTTKVKPVIDAVQLVLLKNKEYLSISEVAILFGCDRRTIRGMIKNRKLNATKISERKTLIKKSNIDKLFEPWE